MLEEGELDRSTESVFTCISNETNDLCKAYVLRMMKTGGIDGFDRSGLKDEQEESGDQDTGQS